MFEKSIIAFLYKKATSITLLMAFKKKRTKKQNTKQKKTHDHLNNQKYITLNYIRISLRTRSKRTFLNNVEIRTYEYF